MDSHQAKSSINNYDDLHDFMLLAEETGNSIIYFTEDFSSYGTDFISHHPYEVRFDEKVISREKEFDAITVEGKWLQHSLVFEKSYYMKELLTDHERMLNEL